MRVPYLPQMEARECGAASLAMVLAYHGHHAPPAEVSSVCGVSRDGVTARQIVDAATRYGMDAQGLRVSPEGLSRFRHPVILHWEMNHFVVLEAWGPKRCRIVDPALGRRVVSRAEVDRCFTGIVLDLKPGASFRRRRVSRPWAALLLNILTEVPGALVMLLTSALLINVLGLALPVAMQAIVDGVLPAARHPWLTAIGWSLMGVVILKSLFTVVRERLGLLYNARFEAVLSERVVRHLLRLPLSFFEQRTTGDVVGRIQAIPAVRDMLAGGVLVLLSDGLLVVCALALMLTYQVGLALAVAAAGALYLLVFFGTRPRQVRLLQERQVEEVKQATELVQILWGMPTLKASGSEAFRQNWWTGLVANELNASHRADAHGDRVATVLFAIKVVTPAVVLLWGARMVLDGQITLGVLVGFQLLQSVFLQSLASVFAALLKGAELPVQIERLADILGAEPEPTGARPCPLLNGDVDVEHVTFSYSGRGRPALEDVSFRIARGQKVAIVGPSGSGKSTLARVLLGLHEPSGGRVLFDGHPLAELDRASVRRQMGVVLQDTLLFAGTIRENLSLSHPDAPLDEIVKAARAARIHDHVQSLPRGYDTPVSSTRGALSGGQRQRIALARAILHRPPVMLLDEATSALDQATEEAIDEYLSRQRCTRIVIAHRLSTVRTADLILVLDQGRIVEQGRHQELLAQDGVYARLALATVTGDPSTGDRVASAEPPRVPPVTAGDLAPFAFLERLSHDDRDALAALLERRPVDEGTRILEQGNPSPGLILLESGAVDVVIDEPGLPPFPVAELGAGDAMAETALINGTPGLASLVARTECRFLVLPADRFAELRVAADPLATRLTLAVGGLVCARLRAMAARHESPSAPASSHVRAAPARSRERTTPLVDTGFGAPFTAAEAEVLEARGETRVYEPGVTLQTAGQAGDAVLVVLRGVVTAESAADGRPVTGASADVLGEVGFFDETPAPVTAVARDQVTCFALPYDQLAHLLAGEGRMALKLATYLARAAIHEFRGADLQLRERVAAERGEREQALRAREAAFAGTDGLHPEDDAGHGPSDVPRVRAPDQESSAAACLTALIRRQGRPAQVARVREACTRDEEMTTGVMMDAARAFGFACRQVTLSAEDLRFVREPLILEARDRRFVVAHAGRRGRLQVMDPLEEARGALGGEWSLAYTGRAFEVRPESEAAPGVADRIRGFLTSRRHWLMHVVVATAVLQVATLGVPLITGWLIDGVVVPGDASRLGLMTLAFMAVIGVAVVHRAVKAAVLRYVRAHFDRELLGQMMSHVLALPLSFFESTDPGTLMQRFQTFRLVRNLLGAEPVTLIIELAVLNISALALLILNPSLAGMVLGVGALSFLIGAAGVVPLRRLVNEELDAAAEEQDRLIEILRGMATLRVNGHRDGGAGRWLPLLGRKLAARFRQERLAIAEYTLIDFVRLAVLSLLLWVGAGDVLAGTLTLGTFVSMYGIAALLLGALTTTAYKLVPTAHVAVHLSRVRRVFDAEVEQVRAETRPPGRIRGRIAFEDVSFSYPGASDKVLDRVSVEIAPGEMVAVVGASGAGKTTLGRLLVGLFRPGEGRILVDGKDLWDLDITAVRRQLGVVLQEPFLFSGSIRQNVALGAPDAPVDDIWAALGRAGLEPAVQALPMKLDTFVAEAGGAFSGGERQRIAIARALVRNPPVVLFDEATSALDNLSQRVVQDSLASLSCTRIVIAHRLSTIQAADRILVLDGGRVVEQGTHTQLLALQGHYARLMEPQLLERAS